ncbi:MAG: ABC transporter permease [Roseiflexaceae bacterium]|jgi:peptide/nickel transport system permease protein|nr:ABC transporter permease [Chloroflexaceae bacterium]
MVAYILNRLVGLFFVFFIVSIVAFLLMHSVPGGPFDEDNMPLSPQQKANILAKYGLDQPIHVQYINYMSKALQGDFGTSFENPDSTVAEIIAQVWPKSIQLGGLTVVLAITLGVLFGILAGIRQNTWIDSTVTFVSTLGNTVPNFIVAIWMMLIFVIYLDVLPLGLNNDNWDNWKAWIMPSIALGLGPMGITARYTRASIVDVISQDYIRTARAKGLSETMVVWRHALKNALIPIITVVGPMVPNLMTGTIFVETMFKVNGIGKFFVTSTLNRDYPMIMALMLIIASLWGFVYLLTDLIYTTLDPRIKFD